MKRIFLFIVGLCLAGPILADSTTPNIGLTLPDIHSTNWGPKVNGNFSIIDSSVPCLACDNIFTGNNSFSQFTLKSGGTLQFGNPSNNAFGQIYNNGASGKKELNLYAPNNGVGINTINEMGSFIGFLDLAVKGGTALDGNPAGGRFAVFGSSADTSIAYSGFRSSSPINQSVLWSLPRADGTTGQALVTDGSSHLSFSAIATAGSFIANQSTLQSGATFFVTSGTVNSLTVGSGGATFNGSVTMNKTSTIIVNGPQAQGLNITNSSGGGSSPNISLNNVDGSYASGLQMASGLNQVLGGATTGDMVIGSQNAVATNIYFVRSVPVAASSAPLAIKASGTPVVVTSMSATGFFQSAPKTLAQIQAIVPTDVGQQYYCSNCTTDAICVSSGTGTGAFVRMSARTTACQ